MLALIAHLSKFYIFFSRESDSRIANVCQSEIKTPLISDIRLIIYLISQISKISDLSEFWSLIFQNSDLSDLLRTLICQNSQISDLSYFWYFRSLILMISDIYELWSILSLINLFFDVSDQKPLSLSESVLSTIKPIDHWAYQPLSLMSIEPIDHRAYWPSSLSTIEPIDLSSSFATFKPFSFQIARIYTAYVMQY